MLRSGGKTRHLTPSHRVLPVSATSEAPYHLQCKRLRRKPLQLEDLSSAVGRSRPPFLLKKVLPKLKQVVQRNTADTTRGCPTSPLSGTRPARLNQTGWRRKADCVQSCRVSFPYSSWRNLFRQVKAGGGLGFTPAQLAWSCAVWKSLAGLPPHLLQRQSQLDQGIVDWSESSDSYLDAAIMFPRHLADGSVFRCA